MQPVLLLPAVQHELQAAQPQRDQAQPDEVHARAGAAHPAQVGRIRDHPAGQQQRHQSDGDVDEEHPAPGQMFGDQTTQGGADGRGHHHRHAVKGHRPRAFPRRERVDQDGLLAGGQAAAADPLQHPAHDQPLQAGRHPAQQRAGDEQGHAGHVEALASEPGGQPAADRHHHRVGDEVRGQHPGALVLGDRQIAGDVGQADVGDGGVQHLHEGGHRHHQGDGPGVAATGPAGGTVDRPGPAAHRTLVRASTDMPGRRRSRWDGSPCSRMRTGMRWTTFT